MADQHRLRVRRRKFRRRGKSRLGFWTTVALLVLAGAFLGAVELSRPHVTGAELRIDTFVDLAERGRINDARILDVDSFVVGSHDIDDGRGTLRRYNTPYLKETRQRLLDVLLENRVPTVIDQQNGKRIASLATLVLPSLILAVLFGYFVLSYRRGTGLFGIRSGARRADAGDTAVTFADVAGQDAAVAELREVREFLSDPQRFADLGASIPKGVLLYGPPGCGKTLLARALAAEAGATFYSMAGSDFVELYVGVGAARVRDLFREAREHAPALIFIDELDSIGRARTSMGTESSHGEQEQGLNQILAEMDGFSSSDGILVIGATNRPDVLDQALLRPGRFDRTIGLERPDEKARLAILELHARGKRLEPDVDLHSIATRAFGMTGADLANVMNEAALLAARARKPAVSQAELDQAFHRVLTEPEKQRRLSVRDRSVGRRFSPDERVTFADVAGVDDAIEELNDVRDYLASPGGFARLGARVPRGILLSGPPGCGKTLLARAVAGEANAAFFSVAGSDFMEMYVGVGPSRVRSLFAEAKAVAPAIVFIDEIDSLGTRGAGHAVAGHREADQTLNQVLVELDGFEDRSAVIVMGATNRPDILDPALLRPGRFDRQVEITMPDRRGRRAILELHARGKRLAPDVDLDVVAGLTRGFSGADLANLLNEAALLATRRRSEAVSMAMVEEALDRTVLGVASRRTIMSDEERLTTAYHEAGHALVALALPGVEPPHRLTIVPRGDSLGHCKLLDSHDRVSFSRSMLIDRMAMGLGGRLAEEIALGEPHTGASGDLAMVRRIARTMVCDEAMSDALGGLSYPDEVGSDGRPYRRYSEDVARVLDVEVRKLVEEARERAVWVLRTYKASLERVAATLLEKETLDAKELQDIAGLPPDAAH